MKLKTLSVICVTAVLIFCAAFPCFAESGDIISETNTVTLPGGDIDGKTLEEHNFTGSTEKLVFEGHVAKMEKYLFENRTALKEVIFTDGFDSIPEGAFKGCTSLRDVIFGGDGTEIGEEAFADCGLEGVTVPGSTRRLGSRCFANCTQLQYAYLETDQKVEVAADAFAGCPPFILYAYLEFISTDIDYDAAGITVKYGIPPIPEDDKEKLKKQSAEEDERELIGYLVRSDERKRRNAFAGTLLKAAELLLPVVVYVVVPLVFVLLLLFKLWTRYNRYSRKYRRNLNQESSLLFLPYHIKPEFVRDFFGRFKTLYLVMAVVGPLPAAGFLCYNLNIEHLTPLYSFVASVAILIVWFVIRLLIGLFGKTARHKMRVAELVRRRKL